jgi:hypothetical protein
MGDTGPLMPASVIPPEVGTVAPQERTAAQRRRSRRRRRLRAPSSGDRGNDPVGSGVPSMSRGAARLTTDSLRTCLTVRQLRRVAGCWQMKRSVPSEQLLHGLVWPGVAQRRWPLAASRLPVGLPGHPREPAEMHPSSGGPT